MVRALACWAIGSLAAKIEMKMTLSIPRTISRKLNVIRLTHAFGSLTQPIQSMTVPVPTWIVVGVNQRRRRPEMQASILTAII